MPHIVWPWVFCDIRQYIHEFFWQLGWKGKGNNANTVPSVLYGYLHCRVVHAIFWQGVFLLFVLFCLRCLLLCSFPDLSVLMVCFGLGSFSRTKGEISTMVESLVLQIIIWANDSEVFQEYIIIQYAIFLTGHMFTQNSSHCLPLHNK